VFAKNNNIDNNIGVEDTIAIILMFKNGIVANLIAVFAPYKTNARWETKIFGSKGSVDLKIREGLSLKTNRINKNYDYVDYYKKFGPNYNFYLQAKSYVQSLSAKKKPFVSIEEGIDSVKIVDAIYKSIKSKKTVNIK
jgi:predicted dehydrogenase